MPPWQPWPPPDRPTVLPGGVHGLKLAKAVRMRALASACFSPAATRAMTLDRRAVCHRSLPRWSEATPYCRRVSISSRRAAISETALEVGSRSSTARPCSMARP